MLELPKVEDSGWKLSGGTIEYEWTKGNLIVPNQLIEILFDQYPGVDDDQQDKSNIDHGVEITNEPRHVISNNVEF